MTIKDAELTDTMAIIEYFVSTDAKDLNDVNKALAHKIARYFYHRGYSAVRNNEIKKDKAFSIFVTSSVAYIKLSKNA